jgi:hypothetical protein
VAFRAALGLFICNTAGQLFRLLCNFGRNAVERATLMGRIEGQLCLAVKWPALSEPVTSLPPLNGVVPPSGKALCDVGRNVAAQAVSIGERRRVDDGISPKTAR